eukprot:TRINITY_DN64691_c0_g1_i1.p1 TRINITY_DN64691_c0_g1~~TRINITY_DN64691_c0_g1_i1.p1  ORF type:complete len:164 (-),score=23.10 TRINITY_DN64691_c0_g1_i1:37-528(-)
MTANNSCRKNNHPVNVYSIPSLSAQNWIEKRLEPQVAQKVRENLNKLPGPTTHTFTMTSQAYGDWRKEDMRKAVTRQASDNWLHMVPPKNHLYRTASSDTFIPAGMQRPKFKAPHIPEDGGGLRTRLGSVAWVPFNLKEYRESWTKGGEHSEQFKKPLHWPTI